MFPWKKNTIQTNLQELGFSWNYCELWQTAQITLFLSYLQYSKSRIGNKVIIICEQCNCIDTQLLTLETIWFEPIRAACHTITDEKGFSGRFISKIGRFISKTSYFSIEIVILSVYSVFVQCTCVHIPDIQTFYQPSPQNILKYCHNLFSK